MPAYALTIFIGAFLLFQIQPLIGKYILPWFGGGPGVWTTCLLFFQIVLLGGYTYAHLITRWLRVRAQVMTHLALLAVALVLLPIIPAVPAKSLAGGNPTFQILALLAISVGVPYFVLSSTGPLMQQWFSRTHPGLSPYRLYALSNVGSLLALVGYPFYFESHFTRRAQALSWGWGLGVYALCVAFCAFKLWQTAGNETKTSTLKQTAPEGSVGPIPQPASWNRVLWVLLPFCASALLLATTNKMCQDVAVIPFLWVLPLALYLLSFIICFDSPRWYVRPIFAFALVAALTAITWALFEGIDASVRKQVIVYSVGLFVCCMVCHGELYRLRPNPKYLTGFYLMISAGGALGGIFVAVIAPLIFTDYYEMHWSLLLCALLFVVVCLLERDRWNSGDSFAPSSRSTTPSEPVSPLTNQVAAITGERLQPAVSSSVATANTADLARSPYSNEWLWLSCGMLFVAAFGFRWFVERSLPLWRSAVNGWLTNAQSTVMAKSLAGIAHTILNSKHWLIGLCVTGLVGVICVAGACLLQRRLLRFPEWRLVTCSWLFLGTVVLGAQLWKQAGKSAGDRIYTSRNFYGQFTIYEENRDSPEDHLFRLQHGRITHGLQLVDPSGANRPTTYYGESSGIGLAMHALPAGARRIGLVGLGTGTLAAYGRKGDYLRIYEINPEARHLATSRFTYISNCAAKVEIVMGDARLSMERELPQHFDLLALDAFSGDAIPVHLLTKEAFEIYQRHLKPDGILAVHISNHYLDLEPVVVNLANQFMYQIAAIDHDEGEEDAWDYSSTWILLSRNEKIINSPAISTASYATKTNSVRVPLWTDDFTSVFQILK